MESGRGLLPFLRRPHGRGRAGGGDRLPQRVHPSRPRARSRRRWAGRQGNGGLSRRSDRGVLHLGEAGARQRFPAAVRRARRTERAGADRRRGRFNAAILRRCHRPSDRARGHPVRGDDATEVTPGPAAYAGSRPSAHFFCASSGFELSFDFDLSGAFELFDLTSTFDTLWELGSKLARTLSPCCTCPSDALSPSRVITASFATLSCCSSPDGSTMVMTIAAGSVAFTSPMAGRSALALVPAVLVPAAVLPAAVVPAVPVPGVAELLVPLLGAFVPVADLSSVARAAPAASASMPAAATIFLFMCTPPLMVPGS